MCTVDYSYVEGKGLGLRGTALGLVLVLCANWLASLVLGFMVTVSIRL